jgi:hypothetical protein
LWVANFITGGKNDEIQNEIDPFFLWERHLAAMIVAGSHSHKGDASLPAERRCAP